MYRQTPSHRSSHQQDNNRPPKMPDRPLVPYMRFSKKTWPKVREENPDLQLWDLGKIIGQLWNSATQSEKNVYNQEYEQEKIEFEKSMKQFNVAYAQYMAAKSRVKSSHPEKSGGGRKAAADAATGVFIQPIEEESNPFALAGKRMAAIRYDRNNKLMAELYSPNYLPDPRTFVPQQRIDHFRRQRQSLEQHQQKSNDELARLEELFSQRKRAIQEASETYQEAMKKVCEERPRVDQERYKELTEQYKEQLLSAWEQHNSIKEADRMANPVLAELIASKSPIQTQEEDGSQQQQGKEEERGNKEEEEQAEEAGRMEEEEEVKKRKKTIEEGKNDEMEERGEEGQGGRGEEHKAESESTSE